MTRQRAHVNFNIMVSLNERLHATAQREGRPLTTILVRALEAYIRPW